MSNNYQDALQPSRTGRAFSSVSAGPPSRQQGSSLASTVTPGPGSFNPGLKSAVASRPDYSRSDQATFASWRERAESTEDASEKRQTDFREQIDKEMKIRAGSENLLEALSSKTAKHAREQRTRVEAELYSTNQKIVQLKAQLNAEIERSRKLSPSPTGKLTQLFRTAPGRSPSRVAFDAEDEVDSDNESPTFILSELLQALEIDGQPPEYYIERANSLVELLKRYPALKYDLAWSIFGLRMQTLLLSDSREVVAASYRVLRHAITDRRSLSIIRSFHTDRLVVFTLLKDSKASVEREQALKFVRAFLDVKSGAEEISRIVVRIIVALAEQPDDRLRSISILTLAEILLRNPELGVACGVLGPLSYAVTEGAYQPAESLVGILLCLADGPRTRKFVPNGAGIYDALTNFTDIISPHSEEQLKSTAKLVASMLKTWPGMVVMCRENFIQLESVLASLRIQDTSGRDIILEMLFDVTRIKAPSWSSSYLAGRRLTTYGHVLSTELNAVLRQKQDDSESPIASSELLDHHTATVLACLLHAGLRSNLVNVSETETDITVKRKSVLLLGEVLTLANRILPGMLAYQLQVLPHLFQYSTVMGSEERFIASSAIYQIDGINRTLFRTGQAALDTSVSSWGAQPSASQRRLSESMRHVLTTDIEDGQFRQALIETQVLSSANFAKWRWDLIQKIVEGPLMNPKRLEEATKASKFVKRLIGFYRPFKHRFADVRNTKPNQRYVRIGCSLMRTLLHTSEGRRYLAENKLLRQVAECLAQVDRLSGITSSDPLFSTERVQETLAGGYFAMLGTLSSSMQGLAMMERWKMANMIFHIVELEDRDDLIRLLLSALDYTIDSQFRVILAKAITSCSKETRIFCTRILRKYAFGQPASSDAAAIDHDCLHWSLHILLTQLYDPEIEVCEAAVKVLEDACSNEGSMEYIVRCRPALDHLGEIGAPLLLRFMSTSLGYHYLDGLDYISGEMDDWFLGRNETYVTLVEASLSKVLAGQKETNRASTSVDALEIGIHNALPPHFYRELTRTSEGVKLLEAKGHFNEFLACIKHNGLEDDDLEIMLKVKGCLWAVGNIGSSELCDSFLDDTDVVPLIIKIAEDSNNMTMRGTAFYSLGLLSQSVVGQEILAEHGWDCAVDQMGKSIGVCLPRTLSRLFKVRNSPFDDSLLMVEATTRR